MCLVWTVDQHVAGTDTNASEVPCLEISTFENDGDIAQIVTVPRQSRTRRTDLAPDMD
jgi:hypothetical protein